MTSPSRDRSGGRRPLARAALVALSLAAASMAGADDLADLPPPFPYDTDFDDHLLHVHPEMNYALHPDWLAAWERGRLGPGGLAGTFGSSATDELLVEARWALNPDLGRGLRLRNDILWQDRRHLPHDRQEIWLGLEQRLWRGLGVLVQTVPAEDKEHLDLRLGAVWASRDRARYLQVLYRHDDLVYDEKNARDGVSRRTPQGVDWLLRLERGAWSVFSRGRWLADLSRQYPDAARAPVIAAHGLASNEALVRLRWRPAGGGHLELGWQLVEDAERRAYRGDQSRYDHDFAGRYRLLSARGLVPLAALLPGSDRWRLRLELHHLARRATVTGYRAFHHARDEVMSAVYAERRLGSGGPSGRRASRVELGYLSTWYDRHDTARGDAAGRGDKVVLSLAVGLARGSALELSLSQEVSEGDFGGGNVRMIAWF